MTRNEKIKKLAQQLDEEDMEYIVEDMEKIDRGIHHIMEINGMLMQNQGAALSGHIQTTLLPFFAETIIRIDNKKDYELTDSVCFICDCLEQGS